MPIYSFRLNYLTTDSSHPDEGVNSVCRTLDLVADQIEIDASEGKILGVLPFRDRWVGCNQTKTSKLSLVIKKLVYLELKSSSNFVVQLRLMSSLNQNLFYKPKPSSPSLYPIIKRSPL